MWSSILKIYEVLGGLEEKGWIGSDNSRPTKYFAKSPNSALQTTKQKLEEDFAKNEKTILNNLNPIYKKSGTAEKPDIWVITCLLYTSPSPRDLSTSRMPSSA